MKKELQQRVGGINRRKNFNIVSNKGGLGKSEATIAVASALRNPVILEQLDQRKDMQLGVFTGDTENWNAVKRLGGEGDPFKTIARIDLTTRQGLDDLVNMVETYKDASVLINDFPANSLNVIGQVFDDPSVYFEIFAQHGYDNYLILPMDHQIDSLSSIIQAAAIFGSKPHYIVAFNPQKSNTSEFDRVMNEYQEQRSKIFEGKTFSEWTIPYFDPEVKELSEKYGLGTLSKDLDIHPELKLACRMRLRMSSASVVNFLKTIF